MDGGFKYEKEEGLFNKRSWAKGYDVIWAVRSPIHDPQQNANRYSISALGSESNRPRLIHGLQRGAGSIRQFPIGRSRSDATKRYPAADPSHWLRIQRP
jgi:hypothetical protein